MNKANSHPHVGCCFTLHKLNAAQLTIFDGTKNITIPRHQAQNIQLGQCPSNKHLVLFSVPLHVAINHGWIKP